MPDDPRVQQLLDALLDTDGTPERVCASCVELLPVVRARWRQMCDARDELDALFPPLPDPSRSAGPPEEAPLPAVPGYEIETVQGMGGMGVVFRARHLGLNRVVALKMALGGAHLGRRERERFRREAEAVAALRHPNVVQVYDVGEAAGRPYFTMEFVDGGSLAQATAGAPVAARDAAAAVATLAGAVEAAHRAGIVHRDLKPANVLRTADGVLKVGDFGVARRVGAEAGLTRTGAAVGTPSYMAPEQARGPAAAVGPAADIYGLGAILYELLTGRPPFQEQTPAETIHHVLHDDPVPPARRNPRVPRDLATICLKCLQKDPDKRYATAADLAADLSRFLDHEPIVARPTGRVDRSLRWVRRRPAAAGLFAAVGLLLGVGGIAAGLQFRQSSAARDRQARIDHEVRGLLQRGRGLLEEAWDAQDQTKLTEALAEGNRAVDLAHGGAADAAVRHEAEAFRADAAARVGRANKTRELLEAVLDVSAGQEDTRDAGGPQASVDPGADGQYAAAFRRWGLDVDRTAEADVVARLRAEPDAVVREVVAALDQWVSVRRRRPGAAWQGLARVAEQLDPNERRRRLRALLAGTSPPRPESAAGLAAAGPSWPALWLVARGDDWRRAQELRPEVDPRTDPVLTVILLSQTLAAVGDPGGAEQVLREAVTTRPDQVVLLDALGKAIIFRRPAEPGKAVEYYRAARARRPRLGIALSSALIRAGRAAEAEDVLRDLLRQGVETPGLYNLLGASLDARNRPAAAEAAYRKAIELDPDFALAHSNLGLCLSDQQKLAEAEAACLKGVALAPAEADAHYHLGNVLARRQKHAAAEAAFRKAVALDPAAVAAHYNLGNALSSLGRHEEAEACYRTTIDLQPDSAVAHNNLGMALKLQGLPGAEAAFRAAVRLQPADAKAHNNLGTLLAQTGRAAEAEAAFRRAVGLAPGFAAAHLNLGNQLMELARFDEAVAVVKAGIALLPERDPLRRPAEGLLLRCQRCLALDARLPALLGGPERPVGAVERIELAQLCRFKGLYAAAARLYADGLAADPKLAAVVPLGTRATAAGCAARAARGAGGDAPAGAAERAALRAQALSCLRADLAVRTKQAASPAAADRRAAAVALALWLQDPSLAGLRPGVMRIGMSGPERAQWDAFWSEVRTTLAEVGKSLRPADDPSSRAVMN
ncbi:MAG TPA: tetratricopeptide repeat protein [Gemmataceae bacterium]|nr:tetratricopeptide repeat protein [Gemmataceae bacterium]